MAAECLGERAGCEPGKGEVGEGGGEGVDADLLTNEVARSNEEARGQQPAAAAGLGVAGERQDGQQAGEGAVGTDAAGDDGERGRDSEGAPGEAGGEGVDDQDERNVDDAE